MFGFRGTVAIPAASCRYGAQHQAVESGDESPHSKRALQVLNLANWSKNYAALGGTPALHWTFLPGEQEFEIEIAHPVPGYLKYGYR